MSKPFDIITDNESSSFIIVLTFFKYFQRNISVLLFLNTGNYLLPKAGAYRKLSQGGVDGEIYAYMRGPKNSKKNSKKKF